MSICWIQGKVGKIEIAVNNVKKIDEKNKLIVFLMCSPHPLFQGTMENKVVTTVVRLCKKMGISSVRFNYRGIGKSEGKYGNIYGEIDDTISVLFWIKKNYPSYQIWLGGFSFGASIAYRVSILFPIDQLFTISPNITNSTYNSILETNVPWTVIHNDDDEIIDTKNVLKWIINHKISFHLIRLKGVSHFFHGKLIQLQNILSPIFKKKLKKLCHF